MLAVAVAREGGCRKQGAEILERDERGDFVPALPGAVWRTTRAIQKRHVSEVLEETLFPFTSLTVIPKSKLLFISKLFFTFLGSMTLLFA